MFSGIIKTVGILKNLTTKKGVTTLVVNASDLARAQKIGSSVSIDGACLTVVKKTASMLSFEAIPESLKRTIIGHYQVGQKVNLEPALKLGDSLDGHLVSGHVDFKSKIVEIKKDGDSVILTLEFPLAMARYFAMKGSVTINGVSLTISKLHSKSCEVSIIPHTQKVTNLGSLKKGQEVNIEIDLIARYLEHLLKQKDKQITYSFLQERGFV